MKKRVILVITSVALVLGLLLAGFGCAGEAPPTEGPPTEGPPTEGPPTEGPPEVKTLKIGLLESLNWPIGTDAVDTIELDVERTNAEGGLLIGGERYLLEIIIDDIKMDPALAKTAAEKQIFEDKVSFIKGDIHVTPYLDLCNDNKVVMAGSPITPETFDPKYKYCFSGGVATSTWLNLIQWIADNYPELKSICTVLPDNYDGHSYDPLWVSASEAAGLETFETQFYPFPTTDVSAVGTKIKMLNPDIMVPFGGGPDMDSLVIKACYVAGWDKQIVDTAPIPGGYFLSLAGPEAAEGIIACSWPAEWDPAATDMAAEFKADWIAKFGEWRDPEPVTTVGWWILKAGLEAATSPDPDEVAAVLANGLEFECPLGNFRMVSRPDYNNPRTVQAIHDMIIKQLVEGKITRIGYISLDEVYAYAAKLFGW